MFRMVEAIARLPKTFNIADFQSGLNSHFRLAALRAWGNWAWRAVHPSADGKAARRAEEVLTLRGRRPLPLVKEVYATIGARPSRLNFV
jgi:hypothetical protein